MPGNRLSDFEDWLADKREEVLDLTTSSFTHLDNVIEVHRGKVRITRLPEELVFVSAKSGLAHRRSLARRVGPSVPSRRCS